jgi:hypothetical protein
VGHSKESGRPVVENVRVSTYPASSELDVVQKIMWKVAALQTANVSSHRILPSLWTLSYGDS